MRYFTTFFLLLFTLLSSASAYSVFDRISPVNKEWLAPPFDASILQQEKINGQLTEQELIRLHLQSVERLLRTSTISGLTSGQIQARTRNLDLLHGYLKNGSFPRNITHKERIPVFVDDRNVPCAVGYLLLRAGYSDFVQQTHQFANNIYIRQIQNSIFEKFQKESGLSIDELALIQPCYGDYEYIEYNQAFAPITDISAMATDTANGLMYTIGKSTDKNDIKSYLTVFNGAKWEIIQSNIIGKVSSMAVKNGNVYIAGYFSILGDSSICLAQFDGNSWMKHHGNNEISCVKVDNDNVYIAGKFTKIEGVEAQYFASYNIKNKSWSNCNAAFNAPVNAITLYRGNVVVGGEFTKNGTNEHLFLSKWDGIAWNQFTSPFNRPVTALNSFRLGVKPPYREVLYAGSSRVSSNDTAHNVLIASIVDTTWSPIKNNVMDISSRIDDEDSILYINSFETFQQNPSYTMIIASIQSRGGGHLLSMGGEFISLCNNDILGKIIFSNQAPVIQYFENYLYIGSESGLRNSDLKIIYLGADDNTSSLSKLSVISQSRDYVHFQLPTLSSSLLKVTVVDILGKEIQSFTKDISNSNQITLDISNLSTGAYYARIISDGNLYTQKILVSY